MSNIQLFKKNNWNVRAIEKDGQPWFVAVDVCAALDVGNSSQAISRLDGDEKGVISNETPGGIQSFAAVTESGLYSLVLGSRKPEAKEFKRWITHEVLPTIRKTGGYVADSERFINAYLPNIDPATRQLLTASLEENRKLNAQIEQQRPMVSFAESCLSSKDSVLVRELAKVAQKNGLQIGEKRLWKKLREWGLVLKNSTEPSQYAMERELFEVIERAVSAAYDTILSRTTKVTAKGQVYIIDRLKKECLG